MLLVVLAIVASTAAGVGADRRYGAGAQRLGQRMIDALLYVLLPPIVFLVVCDLDLGGGVGAGLALAYVELAVVGAIAWVVARRVLHLGPAATGSLVCATILANTGYLGIPLCAALLGQDTIAEAVVWDSVVSAVMLFGPAFAVGAALGTTAGEGFRERSKAFLLRNPVLPAVVAGVVAPASFAPEALVEIAEHAALVLLPVGFFVLGVNLTHEAEDGALRFPPPLTKPVAVVLGLRLVVAPALLALLAFVVVDVPDAYLVQAAMPSGINSLVVAHVYGLDVRLAAASIAWTTTVVVLASLVAAPLV